MLLGEPPPTQADLHFRVLGFPVRVHPFFWVMAFLLGMGAASINKKVDPALALIWIAVVFVSILVHELGHAVMQRCYGGRPWITLYGMGGLASCGDCDRRPRSQIIISFAGPFAGFFLAAFVVAVLHAMQRFEGFQLWWMPVRWTEFNSMKADRFVFFLLYVNIWWGLLNLLPIYPLDGGQVSRQVFLVWNPWKGILYSLYVSAAVAVLVAIYAVSKNDIYLAVLFGFFAFGNFQSIQFTQNHWR
jgi:Zn-dependent protease